MEKITPAFLNNNVPVVFSANDNYVPLLATTLASIIENSSVSNNYDIIVLMTSISDENQVKLRALLSNHSNFSLRFVNVGPYVFGYKFYIESEITNTKYTDEIYFRVLVPSLMSEYDYIVFLDADIVVNDDIAKLLSYDISDDMVGAVRDYEGIANCYNNNYERTRYRINELGIKNFENYFNSGVITMNIKAFNEKFGEKDLLNLAVSKNWKQYDQDLLNSLCNEDIEVFDAGWNFIEDIEQVYHSMPKHLFAEYISSEKAPKIIHYSANRKPWKNISSKYNSYFWKYAKLTPFYDYFKSLENND